MTINEFLKSTFRVDPKIEKTYDEIGRSKIHRTPEIRPRVLCADGFTFSAQADWGKYCEPRVTLYPEEWGDGYQSIELGYPSDHDELIEEYAEDDNWTETVYAYVPVEVVDQMIKKHGGIAGLDPSNIELPDLPDYLRSKIDRFLNAYGKLVQIRCEERNREDQTDIPETHEVSFGYGYTLKMTKHYEWELTFMGYPGDRKLTSCSIQNEPDVLSELIGAFVYDETDKWLQWTIDKEEKEHAD